MNESPDTHSRRDTAAWTLTGASAPPSPAESPPDEPQSRGDTRGQCLLFCLRCGAPSDGGRGSCARCGAPWCVSCGEL
jgi:hypothetical protein